MQDTAERGAPRPQGAPPLRAPEGLWGARCLLLTATPFGGCLLQ